MQVSMQSYRALVVLAALCGSVQAAAENVVIIKSGDLQTSHTAQSFGGAQRNLRSRADNLYGVSWEQRDFDDVAVGAEVLRSSVGWSAAGSFGSVTDQAFLVTLKKYHEYSPNIRPFVGVGAGLSHATFGGGLGLGSALGPALELAGGAEFHAQGIGLYAELKALYAEPGALYGTRVNLSGIGPFVGLSLTF